MQKKAVPILSEDDEKLYYIAEQLTRIHIRNSFQNEYRLKNSNYPTTQQTERAATRIEVRSGRQWRQTFSTIYGAIRSLDRLGYEINESRSLKVDSRAKQSRQKQPMKALDE